ncbi:hypothetical protein [uncultured Aquabacterium sp.]|uniref:hypothetical protein n=1 Tax=Aquabacterium sp. TaxID=1872578 RepID=UPI0025CD93B1|nr:hypothetical protein [uncultured Aquabacterium sp.]
MTTHTQLRKTFVALAVALASGALFAQSTSGSGTSDRSSGGTSATQGGTGGSSSMGAGTGGTTGRDRDTGSSDTGSRAGTLDNMPATGAGQDDRRPGTNATGTGQERHDKTKRSNKKQRSGDTDPTDPHQLNRPSGSGTGSGTGSTGSSGGSSSGGSGTR